MKKTIKKEEISTQETKGTKVKMIKRDISQAIIRPRITEKAAVLAMSNAYAFEIAPWATKSDVAKAVLSVYKMTPVSVKIARLPAKKVLVRGRKGVKSGVKKAYVYLKKGDKIELI